MRGRKNRKILERRLKPGVDSTFSVNGGVLGKDGWWKLQSRKPVFHLTPQQFLKGGENDYLILRIERMGKKERPSKFSATLYWRERGEKSSTSQYFNFKAPPGNLIIPVGSDPRWLLASSIEEVTLELSGDEPGSWWRVSEAKGMRLH